MRLPGYRPTNLQPQCAMCGQVLDLEPPLCTDCYAAVTETDGDSWTWTDPESEAMRELLREHSQPLRHR